MEHPPQKRASEVDGRDRRARTHAMFGRGEGRTFKVICPRATNGWHNGGLLRSGASATEPSRDRSSREGRPARYPPRKAPWTRTPLLLNTFDKKEPASPAVADGFGWRKAPTVGDHQALGLHAKDQHRQGADRPARLHLARDPAGRSRVKGPAGTAALLRRGPRQAEPAEVRAISERRRDELGGDGQEAG